MRKIVISIVFVAFVASAFAQLKVNSLGDTYISKNIYLQSASNSIGTTGTVDAVVAQCKLYQNTPNPFNQSTEIKYYGRCKNCFPLYL